MYNIPKDLLDAFRAAPDVYTALLEGCTQEKARAAKGGDDNPFVAGYDQDEWARERNYAAADLREAFDAFLRFRATHVAELADLTPEQWERPGMHQEQGEINIWGHTLHLVAHDTSHAAQIARQLAGG